MCCLLLQPPPLDTCSVSASGERLNAHESCLKGVWYSTYILQGIDESELDLTPMQLKCVLNCILTEASLYLETKELKLDSFGKPNPEV